MPDAFIGDDNRKEAANLSTAVAMAADAHIPPPPQLDTGVVESKELWYYQEQRTQQPAGPWTVEQLRVRWCRDLINGLTLVWGPGLASWQALAEVPELKEALQRGVPSEAAGTPATVDGQVLGDISSAAGDGTDDAGGLQRAQRQRRALLDEVPLTHTYTSEQGALYVYDTVDADWKASDVYEALVREEQELEDIEGEGEAKDAVPAAEKGGGNGLSEDAELALKELLNEVGADDPAVGSTGMPNSDNGGPKLTTPSFNGPTAAAAATSAEGADEKDLKRQKRHDYRERKKLKRQAGLFIRAQQNPNIYVSGLPADVTLQELEPVFKRAGVLKLDPTTGEAKIRIYADEQGQCKGDALVTYVNAASVELAVKFLHEFQLRPGCTIAVQQADFEEHSRDPHLSKDKLKELASKKQHDQDRVKYLAAKNTQRNAVSWSGDMDDGSGRRIVVMTHLFSAEEAEQEGPDFYKELIDEVQEECEKIGQVAKVTPLERHKQGIVCVKFKSSSEAEECIRVMDGRYFAGRTVEAYFYDGKTDLRALGTCDNLVTSTPALAAMAPPNTPTATLPTQQPNTEHTGGEQQKTWDRPPSIAVPSQKPITRQVPGGEQQKTWDQWLDEQSSDSDSETRICTEE